MVLSTIQRSDIWSVQNTAGLSSFLDGSLKKPVLWQLHGDIADATKLILTPDGTRGYIPSTTTAQGRTRQHWPCWLASHLAFFAVCWLQLRRPSPGDQLRWLAETFTGAAGNHFALVHRESYEAALAALKGVPVYAIQVEGHGQPLMDLVQQMGRIAAGTPVGTPDPLEDQATDPPVHDLLRLTIDSRSGVIDELMPTFLRKLHDMPGTHVVSSRRPSDGTVVAESRITVRKKVHAHEQKILPPRHPTFVRRVVVGVP